METVVALLRNGLCVIKDLDLGGIASKPLESTQNPFPGITPLEICIGALQVAAIFFNLIGGFNDISIVGVHRPVLRAWARVTAGRKEKQPSLMAQQLNAAQAATNTRFVVGICKLFIGVGFIPLAMCSFQNVFLWYVNWGLVGMEAALLVLLGYMCGDIAKTGKKSRDALSFAKKMPDVTSAPLEVVALLADAVNEPVPDMPWPAPPAGYLETAANQELKRFKESVASKLKDSKDEAKANLEAQAYGDSLRAWFDVLLLVLNLLAFIGYFIFPVTFFFPDEKWVAEMVTYWPGHEYCEYYGNLLGDAAWTVEPALLLFVPRLIDGAQASRRASITSKSKKKD
eukprot:CAMPEP_0185778056 /NCGR_PEP_ID=MMETSP1174-20130828/91443_1 /TAXON_ID=35687 /ORGANISM="Dictyocha speculum, Strain CCMP1381" /LENGTH=341 /DNA_ID=CAMNT_0028466647 /DNA_START=24 /DNA_END=1049 /DNA_ORIENTATION=+